MATPERRSTDAAGAALTADQARLVSAIIKRVVADAEVWVFGSRATGRARPFSDLDLLLTRPATLSWAQRADLRDAFEVSELPFKVDVVEASSLSGGVLARAVAERLPLSRAP